jgi:hypothetical protein
MNPDICNTVKYNFNPPVWPKSSQSNLEKGYYVLDGAPRSQNKDRKGKRNKNKKQCRLSMSHAVVVTKTSKTLAASCTRCNASTLT